jgi:predicted nucleotidyltransferase component of viral defense system
MYQERRVRQSELLQLIILDNLYAQSGSDQIVFRGGTALRWVHGGTRFSEDLDFVTHLTRERIGAVLEKSHKRAVQSCLAQFGPGAAYRQVKESRESAYKALFIYRPENQRERIAVRVEFEMLDRGRQPTYERFILPECPQVAGLIAGGQLILPYTSSIILAETLEEILSDKIRALMERRYIKGRDIYDIWWIVNQRSIKPSWSVVKDKLSVYEARFVPARNAAYFQTEDTAKEMIHALDSDLARFIPQNIFSLYRKENFRQFIQTLKEVMRALMDQGMREYFDAQFR